MEKTVSLLLSLVMLVSFFAVSVQSYAAELTPDSDAQSMFALVNKFRTGSDAWYWNSDNATKATFSNLAKYKYDYNLEAIAKIRAKEIAQSFSHTRPDGSEFFTCTVKDADGKLVEPWGENITREMGMTYKGAFDYWCETNNMYDGQGHRRNMLSPDFVSIGIAGFKADDGYVYWVQEFSYDYSAQEETSVVISTVKKNNTLQVKPKTVTIKYSKLKKKNQSVAVKKAMTVSKAQGTVTYVKSKGNKKITVNKKTGKITVKKGLKKGTYKVDIKVKAAGNKTYKSATKKVTVTIKVKK